MPYRAYQAKKIQTQACGILKFTNVKQPVRSALGGEAASFSGRRNEG